jgi:hypothetical protein
VLGALQGGDHLEDSRRSEQVGRWQHREDPKYQVEERISSRRSGREVATQGGFKVSGYRRDQEASEEEDAQRSSACIWA